MTNSKPNSVANLNKALHRISEDDPEFLVIRDYFASIVVAQMLEGCVIKGGSSLKIRYGSDNTRYTNDLDAALSVDENTFIDNLRVNLSKGWENFTGKIIIREKAHLKHIPEQYVMQPYDIKLMYLGKPFCTVRLETTYNEIDDAKVCELVCVNDAKELFEALGFPEPAFAPIMSLVYQVAQKLHGLSGPGSKRVHDLVDLQIIFNYSKVNLVELKAVCERLFAYRKMQSWPPKIIKGDNWDAIYANYNDIDSIEHDLDKAIEWVNDIILSVSM